MTNPTLEFDDTASNPANFIKAEPHIVSEINSQTERMIIPDCAPFYVQDYGMRHIDEAGEIRPLYEGVDFFFVMPYLGAMYGTAKAAYGGVVLNNEFAKGRIEVDYRAIGGPWVADVNMVRQNLIEGSYNPRVVDWDVVTNVQQTFPPLDHEHLLPDMTRITDVLEHLRAMTEAIANGEHVNNLAAAFYTWIAQKNPTGLTPGDLGIPESALREGATDQEVASMLPVDKNISLRQLMEFFQFPIPDMTALNQHLTATGNVHGLTLTDLGLENIKNLPIMEDGDVNSETPLNKYVLHRHLTTMLAQYGKKQPHATAASLYFSQ